jgi:hypothetical protein
VDDSYFALIDGDSRAARYRAGPSTAGPWDERLQHGGPPNALAVAVAAQAIQAESGRTDLEPVRLAADFVGPVPVGVLEVRSEIRRAARSAALVEVAVSAAGRACLLARVWFVRHAETLETASQLHDPVPVPEAPATELDIDFGYGRSVEWRYVRGRMGDLGPATVWARPRIPVLPEQGYAGLARAVLIGDTASGISAELDWSTWTFVNVDLDVHVTRPVVGDWLLMDAVTRIGPMGSGLARSTLFDLDGEVGAGLQTLVIAPRRAE